MRVGSISTCSNPADTSLSRYSFSSSAPATQPTHRRMFCRICGSTSPCVTTSETASRPPGLSTRNASRNTASLSAERLITQFEMITSTELSGNGMCSISPLKNSTLPDNSVDRSEEHTSELQSHLNLVCRLLLEKKKTK